MSRYRVIKCLVIITIILKSANEIYSTEVYICSYSSESEYKCQLISDTEKKYMPVVIEGDGYEDKQSLD